jgi:hypothetical protein
MKIDHVDGLPIKLKEVPQEESSTETRTEEDERDRWE